MSGALRVWESPAASAVASDPLDFLRQLGGPCCVRLPGRDRTRVRAVTTLLHGNEPSGVLAIHALLRAGVRPATDLDCLIASVDAALAAPQFSHRMLPGRRDLNRCFLQPPDDADGALASALLAHLRARPPEALIDLHNTSGAGPAYGVGVRGEVAQRALVSGFAPLYVLTDLRLGSLMEATADEWPTVTIECGGARQPPSHERARVGLERYALREQLFDGAHTEVRMLEHPLRVCLAPRASVAYAQHPVTGCQLTLRADIDRFNAEVLAPGEPIGWLDTLGALRGERGCATCALETWFEVRGGRLCARSPLQLFMATTQADIAREDCLFYAIAS